MKSIITLFLLLVSAVISHAQHKPGSLDSSFGTNGIVIDSFTDGNMMFSRDIQLQPDGKILTVGTSVNRYMPDGKPDLSFGTNGHVWLTDLRPGVDMSSGFRVHPRPDGKIAVVGQFDSNFYHQGYVLQLKTDGKVDSAFGVNGYAFVRFAFMDDSKLMRDGSIITAIDEEDLYLDRIKANGTYDSSFGVNGMTVVHTGQYAGGYAKVDTAQNGRIIIAAIGYDTSWGRSAMIIRFLGNGKPDSSFGTNGKIYLFPVDYCRGIAMQADGKIVAAYSSLTETDIMRFDADGTIDASFGTNGAFTVPYRVANFKLTDSNAIYCAGDDGDFMLSKIKAGGSGVDSAFGNNGTVRTSITSNNFDRPYALCVQSDGKIISAGESFMNTASGASRLTLVRYQDTVARPTSAVATQRAPSFSLFPNPAGSSITLSGISSGQFGQSFDVANSTGQIVQHGTLPSAPSHTLSISVLPAGLYYLRLPSATLPFLKH